MTKKSLKRVLINARKNNKYTQEQVAIAASKLLPKGKSVSRQYYGMIENGERTPSVDVAKAIANVLNINWTIFFEVYSNQKLQNDKQAI